MKRFLLFFVLMFAIPVFASATFTEMSREIVCDCHDCGKKTVDQCMTNCARGKSLAQQIRSQVDQKKSKEQILDYMHDTYGEQVLGVPRQTNFLGKMAPAAPFLILLLGIVPIAFITRTRHKKVKAVGPKQAPQKPIEDDARLDEALKKFDY